jgi:hypothetical protein
MLDALADYIQQNTLQKQHFDLNAAKSTWTCFFIRSEAGLLLKMIGPQHLLEPLLKCFVSS